MHTNITYFVYFTTVNPTHRSSRQPPFELGISSYAYAWNVGVPGYPTAERIGAVDLVNLASKHGVTRLQLADNLPVHDLPAEEWKSLVSQARRSKVQLELGLRGLRRESMLNYLGLAVECGSPFLRVVIDAPGYQPDITEIIKVIQDLLPAFRRAAVRIAIENHDRFRSHELVEVIEATDEDTVGICLDTANSLGADEGIYEVTRTLGPYTLNLHLKDYRIERLPHNMGFSVTGRAAGEGQVPIRWLLDELSRWGRCGSVTLETWSTPLETAEETADREREWSARGIMFLRSILRESNEPLRLDRISK